MNVTVFMLGARLHFAVPKILHDHGRLDLLHTDFWMPGAARTVASVMGNKITLPEIALRALGRHANIPDDYVRSYPGLAIEYWLKRKQARNADDLLRAFMWAGETFGNAIRLEKASPPWLYGFNSASLSLFERLDHKSSRKLLEQTIAPMNIEVRLLEIEADKWPKWKNQIGSPDVLSEFIHLEKAEWHLADKVLCPSQFVVDGLVKSGCPPEKCVQIAYGFTAPTETMRVYRPPRKPLRVLTIGSVGLRKGTPYVIEAAKRLKHNAVFRIVGAVNKADEVLSDLPDNLTFVGSIPRSAIASQFDWCDIFLLPSVCEGSALVCFEALAHGKPVICTPNTGSVVSNGRDGFITEVGNVDEIIERIATLISSPNLHQAMAANAKLTAAKNTLNDYGGRLMNVLSDSSAPTAR
jgi:glycosyltransferase involved in cell wall biosynthesis